MNSPDYLNKFGMSTFVYHEITSFVYMMTRTSETIPVLTQYDSCQTGSKGRTRVFTRIHMKTHTGGSSGTNYEPVWHVPTSSEMVPCLQGCSRQDQGSYRYTKSIRGQSVYS